MPLCHWCRRERNMPTGKLCARCRKRADAGLKPPRRDAMSARLPGHYGAREGG